MKILLIEDDNQKRNVIKSFLIGKGISEAEILETEYLSDFSSLVAKNEIDLFIIDLKVPNNSSGDPYENGRTIIEIINSSKNFDAAKIAISSYPEDFSELRHFFEKNGCILADFKKPDIWKSALEHYLVRRKNRLTFDFIIFCALSEERAPYIACHPGARRTNRGLLECIDIQIGSKVGTIILLPKMGLVNAAIIAGIAIDRYRPKIVAMSGICGGFSKNANLGQLLVSEMVYEYQSGKWSKDGFLQEPYQSSTPTKTVIQLKEVLERENLLVDLESGFKGTRASSQNPPKMAIFTSGSAVIADKNQLEKISTIHRKVAGLDMEIFAIQKSAEMFSENAHVICAKTVVDLCDKNKSDDIHNYGCHVSAKFVTAAIEQINLS